MSLDIPDGYTGPTVVSQPADWRGAWGEYPEITFSVEGIGLTYRWYYRDSGRTSFVLSSERDDCYDSYMMNDYRNGRRVCCVVTD